MRHVRIALSLAASLAVTAGTASAYDSLGGFDQPYTNEGNMFGKGAWGGDGRGTAIPLPSPGPSYGFYYGQPYGGGSNLFGTGYWTSEYTVRTGGGQGRATARTGGPVYADGPLGDGYAGGGAYSGDGKDGKDHGKGGKDYGDKGKPPHHDKGGKKDKWEKPKHDKPEREIEYRYIPYERTRTVVVPRRSATVIVVERPARTELGKLNVATAVQTRSETFTAVCLDGKGNEHAALAVALEPGASYDGEVFRCEGDQMLRVSYPSDDAMIRGAVRTADGSSYKDCDGGDALVRTGGGELMCAPKRPMSRSAERQLAANGAGVEEVEFQTEQRASGGAGIDISGLELTGGVGNAGGL